MLHNLLEDGDWFAAKRYGYGAGLPIAWQGWALTAAYVALVCGLAMLVEADADIGPTLAVAGLVAATIVFVVIVHRRTRGGWRWRWGDGD